MIEARVVSGALASKCTDCDFWRTSQTGSGLYSCNKLMGEGKGPIMFVLTTPQDEEVKQKKGFVGPEGQLLKKANKTVGITDAYYTYLCKCKPAFGANITQKEIAACGKYLIEEINQIKPKAIVVLGGAILPFFNIVGNITKVRGIPVFNKEYNCWVIPTYNPAYLANFVEQARQRKEFTQDLSLALKIVNDGGVAKPAEVNYKVAGTVAEVEKITNDLLKTEWFSFDTETDGLDYFRSKILLTSFSAQPGTGYVIPYMYPGVFDEKGQKEVKVYLDKLLSSPVKKIMQYGKFDLQMLFTANIPFKNFAFDTFLAHALLDENSLHGLDSTVPTYTDMGNYKDEVTDYIQGKIKIKDGVAPGIVRPSTIFDCPYDKLTHYAAQDADATFRLFQKFYPLLEQEGLLKLLVQVMTPLSYVLANMEYQGIGGDINYAIETATKLKAETDRAKNSILNSKQIELYKQKYAVADFNPNSPKQKTELFFDIMGLKPVKMNKVTPKQREKGVKKGSPSTDAESLRLLLEGNKIKVLEDFVILGKLKKSQEYLEDYAKILKNSYDNRIHTTFNQVRSDQGGTITGRLSSSKPNLQNIPSHDPEKAKLIRSVFVAKQGYTFVEVDYSQIEFFIWSHVSDDQVLLKYVNDDNTDIHTLIASQVFKVAKDKVSKAQRTMAKMTVYGMIYGRSNYSIAKEYGMDEDEVNRFTGGFFRAFPQATQYVEKMPILMEKQGYITNLFGRRRRSLDIYSKNIKMKESAQRQARNFPLQSGAADLIYIAMTKLYRALLPYDAKMLIQIHDSLILEIKDEELNTVVPIVKEVMENCVKLKCRLKVDVEYGKCLGDMKDWGKGI